MSHLTKLVHLDLSFNNFIGPLPSLNSSKSLKVLSLNHNDFKGTIPSTHFEGLINLMSIDLGDNSFYGRIPSSLFRLQSLQILMLYNNKFEGVLEEFSNASMSLLEMLDLSRNNFEGSIPMSIFKLERLLSLQLSENKFNDFEGPLHNLSSRLDLHSNQLKGDARSNYDDSVTIVNKGRTLNLVKILIAFTSLDLSSNNFGGPIPEELMNLIGLHALNLSQNTFSGKIPSFVSNLKHLESLDLSMNSLSGEIPTELASLSFLAVMNISYNHLVGKIPTGTQIQSFQADSFIGNERLFGPPLTQISNGRKGYSPETQPQVSETNYERSNIDWNFLSAELGFTFGFGILILPLILWKRWRMWYSKKVDDMLYRIIPQLDFVYEHHGGKKYRTLRWKPY
ncbi:receptor-like protein kinase [Trifolium pratense]|uniref:Receptor-like protein kinase n=1 Tax=Trifolium pratense TaxID=57577 RepID=A0A2K3P9K5_TRIPR|nr:receptor-like protein kinase [Trifolium pratense]PNY11957.1 receptor-like protein kinase [Trifolium pratense]